MSSFLIANFIWYIFPYYTVPKDALAGKIKIFFLRSSLRSDIIPILSLSIIVLTLCFLSYKSFNV